MTCEELKDLYELYTLDVLEDADRDEIDKHLDRGMRRNAAKASRPQSR